MKNQFCIGISAVFIGLAVLRCDSLRIWPAYAKTNNPAGIGPVSATLKGEVLIDKHTTVGFEVGTTTDYNGYYSIAVTSDEINPETISYLLGGLYPGTTYHYRVRVQSRYGTIYGDDVEFTTVGPGITFNPGLNYGSVADIDGNSYKTIIIGTQTWMAENLRTTKFNDGSSIFYAMENSQWSSSGLACYSWLNNEEAKFKSIYGAYYNWRVVGSLKLCPAGWHVPSKDEWATLTSYLGGVNNVGTKLKEQGGAHWLNVGSNNTNSSGFTALPGGYRNLGGTFSPVSVSGYWQGNEGYWWTSTSDGGTIGWYEAFFANSSALLAGSWRIEQGLPVRCLKDN
jgi:uncharacterized protein (TIGR02145 family)